MIIGLMFSAGLALSIVAIVAIVLSHRRKMKELQMKQEQRFLDL